MKISHNTLNSLDELSLPSLHATMATFTMIFSVDLKRKIHLILNNNKHCSNIIENKKVIQNKGQRLFLKSQHVLSRSPFVTSHVQVDFLHLKKV